LEKILEKISVTLNPNNICRSGLFTKRKERSIKQKKTNFEFINKRDVCIRFLLHKFTMKLALLLRNESGLCAWAIIPRIFPFVLLNLPTFSSDSSQIVVSFIMHPFLPQKFPACGFCARRGRALSVSLFVGDKGRSK
jgi:hypothetical protein